MNKLVEELKACFEEAPLRYNGRTVVDAMREHPIQVVHSVSELLTRDPQASDGRTYVKAAINFDWRHLQRELQRDLAFNFTTSEAQRKKVQGAQVAVFKLEPGSQEDDLWAVDLRPPWNRLK